MLLFNLPTLTSRWRFGTDGEIQRCLITEITALIKVMLTIRHRQAEGHGAARHF